MDTAEIIPALQQLLQSAPRANATEAEMRQQLEAHLNGLLLHNFQGLISLLYRVDISEKKLKSRLQLHPRANAAAIIATMILERLAEKAHSRQQFKNDNNIPEEDKW